MIREFRVVEILEVHEPSLVTVAIDLGYMFCCRETVRIEGLDEAPDELNDMALEYARLWFGAGVPLVLTTSLDRDPDDNLIGRFFRSAPIAPASYKVTTELSKV